MHYELRGTLTAKDVKQHIAHPFTVPAGATQLDLCFSYLPERTPLGLNALHLTLFDPTGFRGAGHRRGDVDGSLVSHSVVVSAERATPGYLVGPLPPGEWSVVIDSHMILPDASVTYQITVDIASTAVRTAPSAADLVPPSVPDRGPGWYRGDVHGHTVHSDAELQIADLIALAREYRLDFVTLTDHNTVSGLPEFERLARPDLLTMGGIELTTYAGHALALGVRHWIDWRVRPATRPMAQIAAEVAAAGGLFVIAHPMSVGDPICTGCDWRHSDMRPGAARLIEVWNGGEWNGGSNNEDALAVWYTWLNHGHHLYATAGTDVHGRPPQGARPGFNVVYAEQYTEPAILRAIAHGHHFLSDGPRLEITGHGVDGGRAMMGDQLAPGSATIDGRWEGCAASDEVRLVVDGRVRFSQTAGEHGAQQWQVAAEQGHWCLLELRETSGRLRAVTNPIFLRT